MTEAFSTILKQPYWVISIVLGAALVAFACVTVDDANHWTTHPPTTLWLPLAGVALIGLSSVAFGFNMMVNRPLSDANAGLGLDLSHVREEGGAFSTCVGDCEIRVIFGRIEEHVGESAAAVVLPANEYFDDECVRDSRTALGSYVGRMFEGQIPAFTSLVGGECIRQLGAGVEEQKTTEVRARSFGAGRCVLLSKPLGRAVSIALVATTTQRAGRGLAAQISYLFSGMRELVSRLADARLNEVVMPVLAAGHGGIYPPLALVGLLSAVAEAARYGEGGQRLRKVTIVVFRRGEDSRPEVSEVVVRRALALVGQQE